MSYHVFSDPTGFTGITTITSPSGGDASWTLLSAVPTVGQSYFFTLKVVENNTASMGLALGFSGDTTAGNYYWKVVNNAAALSGTLNNSNELCDLDQNTSCVITIQALKYDTNYNCARVTVVEPFSSSLYVYDGIFYHTVADATPWLSLYSNDAGRFAATTIGKYVQVG